MGKSEKMTGNFSGNSRNDGTGGFVDETITDSRPNFSLRIEIKP